MNIVLKRMADNGDSTLGIMRAGKEICFTVEDEQRDKKKYGETRIPQGMYEVKLRTEGGMNVKYSEKYPYHKGMLWLQDVEGFEWVYIHIGNTDDDTLGCILVNDSIDAKIFRGSSSANAYKRIYNEVIKEIEKGEKVTITIIDDEV